ncbi:MAG: T9SS type A sorting domain-containing protein [Balneolaceae bacterium]
MNYKNYLILLLTLILASSIAVAQDKIWTGAIDSSWHTAGNWSPSGVPTSGQKVSMRNNTTPRPVITTNVTVKTVTINQWYSNPGDQLRIRNNATLTITDDLEIYGTGELRIINGHVILDGGGNKLKMNGSPKINITDGSFTAGSVNHDVDVEIIGAVNLGNGTFSVFGDLDISSGNLFNAENGTVQVSGKTEINGIFNGDDADITFDGDFTVKSGGVFNLDSGLLTLNDNTAVENNGTVNFGSGTVIINGNLDAKSDGNVNIQNANVTVTGDTEFKNDGNLSIDSGTLNITGKAELKSGGSFNLNSGNLNIGGDAKFSNGGTVNAGTATVNLQGDLDLKNGSVFNSDSSTFVFSGDSDQEIKTDNDIVFFNVQVDSGSVVNTDGGGNTIIIQGNLTVDEDANIDIYEGDQLEVQGEVNGAGAPNVVSPSPYAVSATAPTTTSVLIIFNKAMLVDLAQNTANYSIKRVSDASSVTITSATLNISGDNKQVSLVISTINENVDYEITMNNLESVDGREISPNHKKRFRKDGPLTFYSRQNGNWASNSTWSQVSHSGTAAASNPGNTNGAIVIVGDGDIVTIASSTSITSQFSVEIKSSSKLVVGAGGTLTTGTKNITGAGTFEVTTGTLEIGSVGGISATGATGNIRTTTRTFSNSGSYTYNGSSAQVTGSGLPTSVNNLTINNSTGVTLDSNIEVIGTLALTSGSLIIKSGKNLIANTKTIGSGDLIMKREIIGSRGWRLLSSPLNTNYGDFLDGITTQGYTGSSLGNAPLDSLQPNVLYYDETYPGTDNQRWRAPSSAGTTITPGRGFHTYIFGDIVTDSRYNNPFPLTLELQGQENEGPIDFGVTYTTEADSGWNLVGNPYAATINWDDPNWTKTNIDASIYVWDYTTNEYKTWNGTTGDLPSNGLIAPFQGFWIKANDTSPSLVVDEDAKTTNGSFVGKLVTQRNTTSVPQFSITLSDDENQTSTHFMFSSSAKLGKDIKDAFKLLPQSGIGDYIELSSVSETYDKLAINNLPRYFGIPIEIPLLVNAFEEGYSVTKPLNFEFSGFSEIPDGWNIYLVDKETGSEILVYEGAIIPFNFEGVNSRTAPNANINKKARITDKAAPDGSRFSLLIEPGTDATNNDLPTQFKLNQNYPNPFNPSTNIEFELPIQSNVSLKIYDLLGREVATIVNSELEAGMHTYFWDAANLSSGIYIYRLISRNNVITKKMTLIK